MPLTKFPDTRHDFPHAKPRKRQYNLPKVIPDEVSYAVVRGVPTKHPCRGSCPHETQAYTCCVRNSNHVIQVFLLIEYITMPWFVSPRNTSVHMVRQDSNHVIQVFLLIEYNIPFFPLFIISFTKNSRFTQFFSKYYFPCITRIIRK